MRAGLHLPAHKHMSADQAIGNASVPSRIVLNLRGPMLDGRIAVTAGDVVALGQPLVTSKSRVLHASVSGRIAAVQKADTDLTITIDNDVRDTPYDGFSRMTDAGPLPVDRLRECIELAGIVGLGGAAF